MKGPRTKDSLHAIHLDTFRDQFFWAYYVHNSTILVVVFDL
jgi:hypothetical protein